jgi:hypothetical protein
MSLLEEDLIRQIEKAFSSVTLEDGASLNMTVYHDSWGSASEYAARAKFDERLNWKWIADSTLEQFKNVFCFTDISGFRFYLPAYMRWTIKNHRNSDNIISDLTIYALDPTERPFNQKSFIDCFTKPQIESILAFLDYCADNDDSLDGHAASENARKIRELLANVPSRITKR